MNVYLSSGSEKQNVNLIYMFGPDAADGFNTLRPFLQRIDFQRPEWASEDPHRSEPASEQTYGRTLPV